MSSSTIRGLLAASCSLGGVCLAWHLLSGPHADEVRAPPAEITPAPPPPQARALVADDLTPGPDELPNWDEAPSDDRLKVLEERFAVALAALEAGSPRTQHVVKAQAALTAMRAELYGTASGRARHRRHELQLERALGEQPPVAEGVAR